MGSTPATLSFEYRDASGLAVRKDFVFDPAHPYVVEFTAAVSQNGAPLNPTVQWGPALGTGVVERSGSYNPPAQPIFYRDGSVTRVKPSNIQKSPNEEGVFGFVGVDDHYFLTAALPGNERLHVEYQPVSVPVEGSTTGANFVSWSTRAPGQTAPSARYFLGPKDFDVLAGVDRNLVRAIDFGMFSWLVVPLLRALKWVNSYLGNYGWSIIALTVIINLVMFPLRHKSVVSMRKMQDIQPEVKAIQDRYAKLKMSDPAKQKMNVELMNLYRERGVNPGERLRADAPDAACAVRVLRHAVGGHRAPRRAVRRLDSRSLRARSALHHANPHGRHHVRPAADDAFDGGPDAAEDDDVHAARLHVDVPAGAERARSLLDREQPLGDRSAGAHQSTDRSAGATGPRGSRSTNEERRSRTHRAGGKGAEVMDLHERVREFMQKTLGAMGVPLDVAIIEEPDSVRVELSGDGGEQLLRRRAEALDALQHIVNTAFRRELKDDRSFVVDCLDYRKGERCGAEADGALHDGAREDHRYPTGDGTAQPLFATARAHHRRRGSRRWPRRASATRS